MAFWPGASALSPLARSGTAAFGYWLGRHYWGRGIGTDAAKTLSDRALRTGRLRRLEARVFAPNVASARVLEKCGFVFEGRLRDFYIDRNGSICDALNFARFTTNAITERAMIFQANG